MRETDFIRLGIAAAKIEVGGGDSTKLLAEALSRIFDAGVGIGRWYVTSPSTGHMETAGVPSISANEYRNLITYAPYHPRLTPRRLRDTQPFRISDDVHLATFWDTDVWWHHHGIRDGKYPAGVSLGVHDGRAGLIGIHRTSRDFTKDEVSYLGFLTEPLQSALRFRAALDRANRRFGDRVERDPHQTPPVDQLLTKREKDVLALMATGRTNDMVGSVLGITERTVRKHLTNVYAKLEVTSRTAAAVWYHSQAQRGELVISEGNAAAVSLPDFAPTKQAGT